MLEHKSSNTVYLKRVKTEEKLLYGEPIKSLTLFRRYHPRPPTASPSPRLGVRNLTAKLQSLLSQEGLKLRIANLADTFTGSIRAQAHEKFGRKKSVGVSMDGPNFFSTPYYLRKG